MVLFSVPDIRLFWSGDQRFLSQVRGGQGEGEGDQRFLSQVRGEGCRKEREGEGVNEREEKWGRF